MYITVDKDSKIYFTQEETSVTISTVRGDKTSKVFILHKKELKNWRGNTISISSSKNIKHKSFITFKLTPDLYSKRFRVFVKVDETNDTTDFWKKGKTYKLDISNFTENQIIINPDMNSIVLIQPLINSESKNSEELNRYRIRSILEE